MLSTRTGVRITVVVAAVLSVPVVCSAFQGQGEPAAGGAAKGQAPEQGNDDVVIKREALKIIDPQAYKVPLQLSASRKLELIAPADGQIRIVGVKPGQKVNKEAEAFRLDDSRLALLLRRAKANLQGAKIEKKLAQAKNDADQSALADAKLEAAQADLELAQLEVDRQVVRAPFTGEIQRVHVQDGQFVRAGDPLAVLADASHLQVEVPIERLKAGSQPPVELRIEETLVKGKVEAVLPLNPRFEPLRDLADSIASAIVQIDNPDGRFHVGQTVYSSMIPLAPVSSVPTTSVTNQSDGNRKVQVLRESIVRNIPVRLMSKIGTDAVFVSGKFLEGDELIVSSSRELADGTPVRPLAVASSGAAPRAPAAGTAAQTKPAAAAKPAAPKTQGF